MTWSVAGNFTLNNAALPTDLELVLASTGEVMRRETKAAGVVSFNFTVYDSTEHYYVSGYQVGTHVGRSAAGACRMGFDFGLRNPAGGFGVCPFVGRCGANDNPVPVHGC
ncbi:hypothetical protein [Rhodoferax sp.]|uniref:hypothetical protein n=1 Tax=Rhodoferax sp. TaxID=50421 RepID=UPI002ACD400E|nr:hypothetical protein [Rhodoferax sp.]MDZ7919984.1 hypothetical protein [Rhodoferax sp.]